MLLVAAPEADEAALATAIALVHVAAGVASLRRVGRVDLGGRDAEPIFQIGQLGLDDGPAAVAQDGVQPPGQVRVAEVQPLKDQFLRATLGHQPVQHPAYLGAQEAAHVLNQRPIPLAVAGFLSRSLLAGGDHGQQGIVAPQAPEPALPEQLALGGGEQGGQAEVEGENAMSVIVSAALGAGFAHVGDDAEGQPSLAVQVDLHAVGDAAGPLGMIVVGQQRDSDLLSAVHSGQVHPPADTSVLRGMCRGGKTRRPVVQPHGDAGQVRAPMPSHDMSHDGMRETPHVIGDDFPGFLHGDVSPKEPRAHAVHHMEHVPDIWRQGAAVHRLAELVGPVRHPSLQLTDDLIAAHLHAVCRADHGGERHLVHIVVLVEPPRLEEQAPLLAPKQHRTGPVVGQQVQHLRSLARRQVGRQEVGAVYRRVFGALPWHQAPFAVRKP